jgi:hypothetical protein
LFKKLCHVLNHLGLHGSATQITKLANGNVGNIFGWYRWSSRCGFCQADLKAVLPRRSGRLDDPAQ